MSPALIDTGASTQNPLHQDFKGQIRSPSPISSFEFSGFMSNQQRASSFDMNSRGQSGFENSSAMNPNFEFSSPAASKFGSEKPLMSSLSSLSRPRMAKSRKSLTSRAMGSSETRELGLGFNPFHALSHNLSGFSSGLESDDDGSKHLNMKVINEVGKLGDAFIEETGKLEIERATVSHMASQNANNLTDRSSLSGNQQHSKVVENIGQSELPDCMKKLNLGGSLGENSTISGGRWDNLGKNREASLGYSSGHNVGGFFGATLPSELPNDFERLNRKNTGEVSGQNFIFNTTSRRDFVFSGSGKNSDPLSTGIATTLPEKIENLNIEDCDKSNGAQKDMNFNKSNKTFDSDSRATGTGSGPSGRAIDPMILDKMERLNTGDCSEGSSDRTDPGGFSSLRKGGMGITSKNAHGESNETVFPSLIPEQGKHPWSPQVSMGQSNRGVELHPAPASSKSTFQSFGLNFQPLGEESQKPCMDATEKKDSFGFSSTHDGLRLPHVEFRTPDSKCNLFAGSSQEIEFSAKGSVKYTLLKGRKGKPKESASVLIAIGKSFVPKDNSREAFSEPSESYSPMDVSPYQETEDDAQSAREPSSTSDDQTSNFSQAGLSNDAAEEDLVTAKECIDANKSNDVMHDEANTGGVALEDSVSVFETQSFKSAKDKLDRNGENEVESTGQGQSSDPTQYLNASSSVSSGASSFTFAASTPVPHPSASIRHQKKKNRMKAGDLYIPTRTVLTDAAALPFSPISGVSMILSPVRQQDEVPTAPQKGSINVKFTSPTTTILGGSNLKDTKREVKSLATASYAAQEACEKWRLRGNQAYSCGDLEKAEDYYTQGLSCIPQNETSSNCLRALVLCYSNRAATRMSLGRMREALEDCLVAAKLDPNFLRVRLRAANCYLALGEVVDASRYFQKLLQATEVCVEHKLLQEASDGVQKAQKVSECMDCSAGLLLQRKPSDIESALRVIAEALVISPYSEQLLERRAEAVFMLGRHEEVIELCVQSLEAAEKNSPLLGANGQSSNLEAAEPLKQYYFRIWRYRLIFKSNFHLGKLEDALDFLENQEQWRSLVTKYGNDTLECLIPQLSTARELIRHKLAGNEAFQAGRHTEAVEHYTAALSFNVESRPFAAVCFGNRAAAYQALGQIIDAIADCSLAIALDGSYLKAISRRATLFEIIRDYEQAAKDLQKLVSLWTKQAEGKANQSGASSATSSLSDLRQSRQRLYQVEEQAKKGIPLNFYLILGVEPSVTAADLRKAYRKAALKHHPDKAGQSLARSDSGEGLWKEIAEEVHKDADRLFKMIGEAYAVLSDPTKRSQYDTEEEMRNGLKKNSGSMSRMHTDSASNTVDRGGFGSGRQWREAWRPSNPYYRGFEPTKPSRH